MHGSSNRSPWTARTGLAIARAAVAATAVFMATGCSIARPTASATAAAVGDRGAATARVDITLDLSNSGRNEVELVSYDYMITLEDGSSYDGRWAALRALPPGQTVKATVPAVLPVASVREGMRWKVSGSVAYRDPQSIARILYEAGILKTESAFTGEGTLSGESK